MQQKKAVVKTRGCLPNSNIDLEGECKFFETQYCGFRVIGPLDGQHFFEYCKPGAMDCSRYEFALQRQRDDFLEKARRDYNG